MAQPNLDSTREDLQFVRNAIGRHGPLPTPLHSRILWACYCLIGCVWIDVGPRGGSAFLTYGLLAATVLDLLLTKRLNKTHGRRNRTRDLRQLLQTGAFIAACLTVCGLMNGRVFSEGYGPGQVFLVLVGYHLMSSSLQNSEVAERWLTGGVVLGLAYLIGSILLSYSPNGVWSALGVISDIIIGWGFDIPKATEIRGQNQSNVTP